LTRTPAGQSIPQLAHPAEFEFMSFIHRRRLSTRRHGLPTCVLICVASAIPPAALCRDGADGATLAEVVVTARKFPEAISRVPMSVQALSGEFLDRRDLSSLYELQFEVPGLVVNNRGMFGAGISLRGVADEGGSSLAVAPHINGVYLGKSSLALSRQFDIERVEIVKGPQGTLYGRNATGGSIDVITRIPETQLGAAVEGARGSFNTTRIRGHVNLPGEKLSTRISVAGSEGDGFIRNVIDDRRFSEEDYGAVRASVRALPGDAITIDAMVQHVADDGASGELWLPRPDQLPSPHDIALTRVTLDDPYLSTTNDFASVSLAYDFHQMTLRSISGYARSLTRGLDDCAGVPMLAGCVRGVRPLRYTQRSQEIRVESKADGSFDWIAGLFWFDGVESAKFHYSNPSVAPIPINDYTATADESAYAVFGDATYALAARWRLNGGLRFSREKHRVTDVGHGIADYPTPIAAEGSWDSASWRLGLEFSPIESLLVYANASTGFRSGGITTELLPDGEFDAFDPENLVAYEVGMNVTRDGGRSTLRASAFAYEIEDMQVRTTALLQDRVVSVIDNAAAARIHGLDLSASTRVAERLTLSGMMVWMPRREFVEFIDARGATLSGNEISRASEWSVSASVGYRIPVEGVGEFSADVDYNYRSKFFFTKENDPITSQRAFGLLNLGLRFDAAKRGWYVFASARNLLDEDYFTQAMLQSAPGYPANYEIGFGWRL
jgi:iron complex outermembrane receptor protein